MMTILSEYRNKDNFDVITEREIDNEEDLDIFCRLEGWDTDKFSPEAPFDKGEELKDYYQEKTADWVNIELSFVWNFIEMEEFYLLFVVRVGNNCTTVSVLKLKKFEGKELNIEKTHFTVNGIEIPDSFVNKYSIPNSKMKLDSETTSKLFLLIKIGVRQINSNDIDGMLKEALHKNNVISLPTDDFSEGEEIRLTFIKDLLSRCGVSITSDDEKKLRELSKEDYSSSKVKHFGEDYYKVQKVFRKDNDRFALLRNIYGGDCIMFIANGVEDTRIFNHLDEGKVIVMDSNNNAKMALDFNPKESELVDGSDEIASSSLSRKLQDSKREDSFIVKEEDLRKTARADRLERKRRRRKRKAEQKKKEMVRKKLNNGQLKIQGIKFKETKVDYQDLTIGIEDKKILTLDKDSQKWKSIVELLEDEDFMGRIESLCERHNIPYDFRSKEIRNLGEEGWIINADEVSSILVKDKGDSVDFYERNGVIRFMSVDELKDAENLNFETDVFYNMVDYLVWGQHYKSGGRIIDSPPKKYKGFKDRFLDRNIYVGHFPIKVTTETKGNRTYHLVEGYRIRKRELKEVIRRAICYEDKEKYHEFLNEVSTVPLEAFDLIRNGVVFSIQEGFNSYNRFKFNVKRSGRKYYIYAGDIELHIEGGYSNISKLAKEVYASKFDMYNNISKYVENKEDVIELINKGEKKYVDTEKKGKNWLEDIIERNEEKVRKVERKVEGNKYKGIEVDNELNTYFITGLDNSGIKTFKNKGGRWRYICLNDREFTEKLNKYDRLVHRLKTCLNAKELYEQDRINNLA